MLPSRLSRRAWLISAAAFGCRRPPKATPYAGYCLVANQESRSVALIDLSNFRRLRPIPLDAAPSLVCAHPARPKGFALAPASGTVYEIDAATYSLSRRVRICDEAVSMKLDSPGKALWILARRPAALIEVPLDSLRPARHIRLSAPPDDFDLSIESRAAVISRPARLLTAVSLERAVVESSVAVSAEPTSICFQFDGKQIITASGPDRSITIFGVALGTPVVRLPLPFEPRRFCFTTDGGQMFLTGDGMDAVAIVYPYQTEIAETILAGHAPGAMATTGAEAGSYLLVANPTSNTVTVINIDDRRLVSVVAVGQAPSEILITPDNQYALVLNEKSGDLAVIRLYSLENPQRAHRYKSAALFTLVPVGAKPVSAAVVKL